MTISRLGFEKFNKTVDGATGQIVEVNAKMRLQSKTLTILLTAPRATAETEAINLERMAASVLQLLPAEVIRILPSANMVDALGRLQNITLERDEGAGQYVQPPGTEPRLTNAAIYGVNVPSPEPGVRQIRFTQASFVVNATGSKLSNVSK